MVFNMGLIDDLLGIKARPAPEPKEPSGAGKKGLNWGGKNPYTNRKSYEKNAMALPSNTKPWNRPHGTTTAKDREGMAREVLGDRTNLTNEDIAKRQKFYDEARKRSSTYAEREEIKRKSDFLKQITNPGQKPK